MSAAVTPDAGKEDSFGSEVAIILSALAPEEVDMLRDAFIYMDRDSDGFVSLDEMMTQVATCVGASRFTPLKEYLLPLFFVADKDQDGRLSLMEFLMAFADGPGVVPAEVVNSCVADVRVRLTDEEISALQSSFHRIDTKRDDVIDPEELEVALRAHLLTKFPDLTEENFKEIVSVVMASADTDRNGVLSLSEFIRSYQEDQGVLPATFLEPSEENELGARQLAEEEVKVLQEAFAVLDRNDDGLIDVEDLYMALWDSLGGSEKEQSQIRDLCDLIMMTADRSKSGKLTVTDFVRSFLHNVQLMQIPVSVAQERVRVACEKLQHMHESGELERLVMVFEDLDGDGDGFVVRSELVGVLTSLFRDAFPGWDKEMLNSVMTAIVVGAETNNGGQLSLEEFIRSFVDGPGVLPPEVVQSWDSGAARSSPDPRDTDVADAQDRASPATDADLSRIGEAVRQLYAKQDTHDTVSPEALRAQIMQLYVDDPQRGEAMADYALQQFVVQREDGQLTWSDNVVFEEDDDDVVPACASGSPDTAAERSSADAGHQRAAPAPTAANEAAEPSARASPKPTPECASDATSKAPRSSTVPASITTTAAAVTAVSPVAAAATVAENATTQSPTSAAAVAAAAVSAAAAAASSRARNKDHYITPQRTPPNMLDGQLSTVTNGRKVTATKRLTIDNQLYGASADGLKLDEELKQQFDAYDVDHKGYLDRETFKEIYTKMENYGLDLSPMEVNLRFSRYGNKSDKIGFNEFCILMLQRARL